jgi:hypothetical protein
MLQPSPCVVGPQVDLEYARESGEKQPVRIPFAAEIAADESRHCATAAHLENRHTAGQEPIQRDALVEHADHRSVRHDVRVAVRHDDDVALLNRQLYVVPETGDPATLSDEVIADQALRGRREQLGIGAERRYGECPRLRAHRVVEDGAGDVHGA